jgi:hypothetical protein
MKSLLAIQTSSPSDTPRPIGTDEPYEGVAAIDRYAIVFARTIHAVCQQGLDVWSVLG